MYHEPRVFDISSEQLEMHRAFWKNIKSPIWLADEKKKRGWRKCFIRILLKGGKSSGQTCFLVWSIFLRPENCAFFSKEADMTDNRRVVEEFLGQKMATNQPVHGMNIEKVVSGKFFMQIRTGCY